MNTRIKEMLTKPVCERLADWDNIGPVQKATLEKFAELIVRECADLFVDQKYMIINPHEPFANERVRALKQHDKDTVKKIKLHFGVEE